MKKLSLTLGILGALAIGILKSPAPGIVNGTLSGGGGGSITQTNSNIPDTVQLLQGNGSGSAVASGVYVQSLVQTNETRPLKFDNVNIGTGANSMYIANDGGTVVTFGSVGSPIQGFNVYSANPLTFSTPSGIAVNQIIGVTDGAEYSLSDNAGNFYFGDLSTLYSGAEMEIKGGTAFGNNGQIIFGQDILVGDTPKTNALLSLSTGDFTLFGSGKWRGNAAFTNITATSLTTPSGSLNINAGGGTVTASTFSGGAFLGTAAQISGNVSATGTFAGNGSTLSNLFSTILTGSGVLSSSTDSLGRITYVIPSGGGGGGATNGIQMFGGYGTNTSLWNPTLWNATLLGNTYIGYLYVSNMITTNWFITGTVPVGLVPTMTSPTTPYGQVIDSGPFGGQAQYAGWHAFAGGNFHSVSTNGAWVEYVAPGYLTATGAVITISNGGPTNEIQVSSDGINFTTIYSNNVCNNGSEFPITTTTAQYWRFYFPDAAAEQIITGLQLFGLAQVSIAMGTNNTMMISANIQTGTNYGAAFVGDASMLTNQNVSTFASGNTSSSNAWNGKFTGDGGSLTNLVTSRIVAGANITITTSNPGQSTESITIASTGGGSSAITNAAIGGYAAVNFNGTKWIALSSFNNSVAAYYSLPPQIEPPGSNNVYGFAWYSATNNTPQLCTNGYTVMVFTNNVLMFGYTNVPWPLATNVNLPASIPMDNTSGTNNWELILTDTNTLVLYLGWALKYGH